MNKVAFISTLVIVALLLGACGGSAPTEAPAPTTVAVAQPRATPLPPSATPLPPTATPLPPTETPVPVLALQAEPFRNEEQGYAIRYPEGWQTDYYEDMESDLFYSTGEAIEEVAAGDAAPDHPVVVISAGARDTMLDGELQDVPDVEAMLEWTLTGIRSSEGYEEGPVQEVTVGGEPALAVDVRYLHDGSGLAGREVVMHLGDRAFIIAGIGPAEAWPGFAPTFDAMLDTLSLFKPVAKTRLVEYDAGAFVIGYPEGWEVYSKDYRTAFYVSEEVLNEQAPSVPVVVIEAGPLSEISDGELAGAKNSVEMIEALVAARQAAGKDFQIDRVREIEVADRAGAGAGVRWFEENQLVMNLVTAVHLGDWGILLQAVGAAEGWGDFQAVYIDMVEGMTIAEPPIGAAIDWTDPVSVLQAVFAAAQTQDYAALAGLCDPQGEADGDAQAICAVAGGANQAQFVEYFSKGQITGEAEIQGELATVPFSFGPNGDQAEIMTLILRDGKWYLLEF